VLCHAPHRCAEEESRQERACPECHKSHRNPPALLGKRKGWANTTIRAGSAESGSQNVNPAEITVLLKAWRGGDSAALDRLTPVVYEHLRRLARSYMRKEGPGHTLQTTALVNETFLRLIDARGVDWRDRTHFFALCARMMRRILIDAARERKSLKRGGQMQWVEHSTAIDFDLLPAVGSDPAAELCALDDALETLARMDTRRAQV